MANRWELEVTGESSKENSGRFVEVDGLEEASERVFLEGLEKFRYIYIPSIL